MKPAYISHSALSTYTKCGKMYEYKYRYGIRQDPTEKMVAGKVFHEILHLAWVGHAISRGVVDMIADESGVEEELSRVKIWNAYNVAKEKVIGNPDFEPIGPGLMGCEMRIEGEIVPGANFLGFADLVTKGGVVYDYKFVMSGSPSYRIENSIQLALYAYMLGIDRIGYLVFSARKDPSKTVLLEDKEKFGPIKVPDSLRDFALRRIENVHAMIQSGMFWETDPSNWWCGPSCQGYQFCFEGTPVPTVVGANGFYKDWFEAVDDDGA